MKLKRRYTLICFSLFLLYYGCDYVDPIETFEPKLVIQSYLYESRPFSNVVLKQTISDEDLLKHIYYQENDFKLISDAEISLSVDDSLFISLIESPDKPGRYIVDPNNDTFIAKPSQRITLDCIYENQHLSAETIVPDSITLNLIFPQNDIYIDSTDSVVIHLDSSSANIGYFVKVEESEELGPDVDFIYHKYLPSERYFLTTSNTVIIPNNFFRYYGIEYIITVLNLDQNLFDFYRSLTHPPFDPEPVIMHVEGGLGIFGSASKTEVAVVVQKIEN
ncbi:MAG: DUF4249 family protein [Planctomycetia bacterium]|nr:DUF4249 family protein [Planctomycetia bacterium]